MANTPLFVASLGMETEAPRSGSRGEETVVPMMSPQPDVVMECVCGGRLVITKAPESMRREVEILVACFKQEHGGHGTGGVREPRHPKPSTSPTVSMTITYDHTTTIWENMEDTSGVWPDTIS